MSAARQAIFEAAAASAGPLRLYCGNPKALAPHHDRGVGIPASPAAKCAVLSPERGTLSAVPSPHHFRSARPWLIYAVLAAASLALAAIPLNLVRASQRLSANRP